MERVGVRELRQRASEILRRVSEDGESYEITDRGRLAALLIAPAERGLKELERRGLVRRSEGDLLALRAVKSQRGRRRPSELVGEGRGD